MNEITLSVIIPVYNSAPFLRRCLDSILNQTRLPDEIICVDDGSIDDSFSILREYASIHRQISVLSTENAGAISARKKGTEIAKGKYVTYVDSDDWIDVNMYSEMLGYALDYDADVVTSGLLRDYGKAVVDEEEHIRPGLYEGEQLYNEVINKLIDQSEFFQKNIAFNVVNKLFRRDIIFRLQNSVPDNIFVGEDLCVSYPCIMASNRVYVTGKSYYHYCIRHDSVMGSMSPVKYDSIKRMLEYMRQAYFDPAIRNTDTERQYTYLNAYMHLFWKPEEILHYHDRYLDYYGLIPEGARVIVYGAGGFGISLKAFMDKYTDINTVAWVDKSSNRESVRKPEIIQETEYDYILIAILISDIVKQVFLQLKEYGVPEEKILRINPEQRN